MQLYEGEQSERLLGLADALLDRLESIAERGTTASSLKDGLEKLQAGTLAPETLDVRFVRLPDEQLETGVILHIEGDILSRQAYTPGEKLESRRPQAVTADCVRRLAS